MNKAFWIPVAMGLAVGLLMLVNGVPYPQASLWAMLSTFAGGVAMRIA